MTKNENSSDNENNENNENNDDNDNENNNDDDNNDDNLESDHVHVPSQQPRQWHSPQCSAKCLGHASSG